MKIKNKYKIGKVLYLALALLVLSFSLYACDENEIPSITEAPETTEVPVTTLSPLVTVPAVDATFDQAQMDKFLALVKAVE